MALVIVHCSDRNNTSSVHLQLTMRSWEDPDSCFQTWNQCFEAREQSAQCLWTSSWYKWPDSPMRFIWESHRERGTHRPLSPLQRSMTRPSVTPLSEKTKTHSDIYWCHVRLVARVVNELRANGHNLSLLILHAAFVSPYCGETK